MPLEANFIMKQTPVRSGDPGTSPGRLGPARTSDADLRQHDVGMASRGVAGRRAPARGGGERRSANQGDASPFLGITAQIVTH